MCNCQDTDCLEFAFKPVQFAPVTAVAMSDKCACNMAPAVPSVHQTLDEMDFERGLWHAALTGDLERVRELVNKGHDVNAEDGNGYSPLHYAARCGYTAVSALLLEAGANINAVTRAGQSTPLHRAALAGQDETVRLLLRYKADPRVVDVDRRNALHRAVEGRNVSTVRLLLRELPRDLAHAPDKSGITPSDCAKGDPDLEPVFDSALSPPPSQQ